MTAGRRSLNAPDDELIGRIAASLKTDASFVEKDWHAVRALAAVSSIQLQNVSAVFSGGTSLSKGFDLIKRFSEDIDFKVGIAAPSKNAARNIGRDFREAVLTALTGIGFKILGEPMVGNEGRFLRINFDYGATRKATSALREGLQLEITFEAPKRDPIARPVSSLVAQARREAPEVPTLLCVDPLETAADKLSALAWRTHARDRSDPKDDPTIVRHLHDLALLKAQADGNPAFADLAILNLEADASRAKTPGMTGMVLVRAMLPRIGPDKLWREEYERFVAQVSYAPAGEEMTFDGAVEVCQRLVDFVCQRDRENAAAELKDRSGAPSLGGLNIKDMIEDGRH